MEKEFLEYTEALELKELGFDEPCLGWYQDNTLRFDINSNQSIKFHEHLGRFKGCFLAPLYQQAFKWFRLKYEYEISIHKLIEEDGYMASIGWVGVEDIMEQVEGNTHEEAELECLKKLIQIVKNK